MTDRIKALEDALTLAANRLHRVTLDFDTGSRRLIEALEWAAEARAALAASQPAPDCHQPDLVTSDSSQPAQPVAVAVKPLVWRGFVAGNYRIEVDKVGIAKLWRYSADIFESEEPELLRMGYLTLISVDDLKSAAQADYEARILAALEPQPLTVQDAARVVADGLADGEVWRVAVNGAAAILNSGMPESYWPPVKQIRETLDAALRAIAEGRV